MSTRSGPRQANAALVLESFEAFDAGDTESLLAVASPDLVMHFADGPPQLESESPRT